jgi:RNA exonuclease 4
MYPAQPFKIVRRKVEELLEGRILVGHALENDLSVLDMFHPLEERRDTAAYRPFRDMNGGRAPSLKKLSETVLGVEIQSREHDSVKRALEVANNRSKMHRRPWLYIEV